MTNETEYIPEVIRTTEPEVTPPAVETPVKTVTELCRLGRVMEPPEWLFHNEIFILEEDEPTRYREVMVEPSSKE